MKSKCTHAAPSDVQRLAHGIHLLVEALLIEEKIFDTVLNCFSMSVLLLSPHFFFVAPSLTIFNLSFIR